MKFLSRQEVFRRMRNLGHAAFKNDQKNYNINVIGIRSKTAKLDDYGCQLLVAWKFNGVWSERSWPITTYPGSHYLIHKLLNSRGAAILVPGQYKGVYSVRKHNGRYDAFCQTYGPVKVFRDGNRDRVFDMDPETIMRGHFGINIHRSALSGCTYRVNKHGAGCQVFKCAPDFKEFMDIVKKSRGNFGNKFTYTLIEA